VAQGIVKTDSLDLMLRKVKNPNEKVDLIIKYLEEPENQYSDKALIYATRAYQIAHEVGYSTGKLRAMLLLGNYAFRSSDYKQSMEYAQRSKSLAEDLNLRKEMAYSLRLMGTIYNEFGVFDNSSQYFFKSLKIFEELNDSEGISQSLGDIGMDFYYQQDYTKALEYYNRALNIAQKVGNLSLIKRQYNNIAIVYGDQQKSDVAIQYLKKAILINQKLNDQLGEGTNIMNIGFNQLVDGDFNAAIITLKKAMDIFVRLDNRTRIAECYLDLGICYQNVNNVVESIHCLQNAIRIAQELKYYRLVYMSAQVLDNIYTEVRKDTIQAYKYVVLQKLANDSMYASQNQKQLTKLELQYLFEKKEIERKHNQNVRNTVTLIVIFGLLAGIIILALSVSRFKLKSKFAILEKKKIKTELDIKKRELSLNILSLIRKNEMLSDVSEELINLEKQAETDKSREIIESISKKLRSRTDDKILEEFSVQFQEVHAGFYETLLNMFPDLTQNELKLCAFLRLNMSTKDISELTGQHHPSIDKARYRLRKKLGLSYSETSLVSFLSQL